MSSSALPPEISRLRTDFVPSESESIPIRAAIGSQREAIADIDSRIWILGQQICDLHKERDAVLSSLAVNEAFLAPVRRLAPEILGKIFEHCVNTDPQYMRPTDAPLLLMGVSHNWRRVTQETPRLWTKIHINPRTVISSVVMCIQNSRTLPLNVIINLHPFPTNMDTDARGLDENLWHVNQWPPNGALDEEADENVPPPPETLEIVHSIIQQLARIQQLKLHCLYSILSVFFPQGKNRMMPLLEEIKVECPDIPHSRFVPSNDVCHLEGARLHTLILHEKTFSITSIKPTSTIRRLSLLGRHPITPLLEFLGNCPGIEEFHATNFTPRLLNSDIPESEPDPIVLPNLSRLELEWRRSLGAHPRFLGSIRAPKVQTVVLRQFPGDMDEMHIFLTATAFRLSQLSLEGLKCSSYQFYRIMKDLRMIEMLTLTNCRVAGSVYEALTPEKDETPSLWICPRLTSLELSRMALGKEFLEFVRRRTEPSAQGRRMQHGFRYLTHIILDSYDADDDEVQVLRDLQSQREGFSFRDIRNENW